VLERFNARIAGLATGRNVLLLLVAAMGVFALFGAWLVPAFQAVTGGRYPVDLAFPITPAVIRGEYAHYGAESIRLYHQFLVVDFMWPPLLGAWFALAWAWLACRTSSTLPARMIAAGVFLLPFAEALLDLTENVGFLALLAAYPGDPPGLALATSLVRAAKLVLYALCWLVLLMFAALAVGRSASRPRGS
jgi:hypothetical protein